MGQYAFPAIATTQQVFANSSSKSYLTNVGANVIYIDSQPQVTSTSGNVLNPGASIDWHDGQALYVVSALGSTLSVSTDSGNVFDPSSIASALTASGLALAIAQQTQLLGIPSIDQPAIIVSQTQNVASGVTPTSSLIINSTRYTSIIFSVNETAGAADTSTRTVTVTWYADAAATIVMAVDTFMYYQYLAICRAQFLCKGAYFKITSTSNPNPNTNTIVWTIVGTTRNLDENIQLKSGALGFGGANTETNIDRRLFLVTGTATGPGSFSYSFPDIICGPCVIEANTQDSPGTGNVFAWDIQETVGGHSIQSGNFGAAGVTGTNGGESRQIILPRVPIQIQIFNNYALALQYNLSMSWPS